MSDEFPSEAPAAAPADSPSGVNAPLPTEEEHRQAKIDKAAESGDSGSDVQPNAKAAADHLATLVAPTPAIPGRPETATPPTNVVERQRANMQPLPTDEELAELEQEAGPIVEIAKKMFFIADDAGEPTVDTGTNAIFIHYPDGSQISVRFEIRPGEFQSIGAAASTPAEAAARNKKFSDAKKARDERKKAAADAAQAEAKADANARSESKQGVPPEPVSA